MLHVIYYCSEAVMFEKDLKEFNKNLELERYYAVEKRVDDVMDSFKSRRLSSEEYASEMEEMSAELDDIDQSFKDVLKGAEKKKMTGKVKDLKSKIDEIINKFYHLGY